MLLNIGNKVPEWASPLEHNSSSLKSWWDGLEWQEYKVPDLNASCNFGDPTGLVPDDPVGFFKETLCHADHTVYDLASIFPGDWFYKMAANAGMQVRIGLDQEIANLGSVVKSWIGL